MNFEIRWWILDIHCPIVHHGRAGGKMIQRIFFPRFKSFPMAQYPAAFWNHLIILEATRWPFVAFELCIFLNVNKFPLSPFNSSSSRFCVHLQSISVDPVLILTITQLNQHFIDSSHSYHISTLRGLHKGSGGGGGTLQSFASSSLWSLIKYCTGLLYPVKFTLIVQSAYCLALCTGHKMFNRVSKLPAWVTWAVPAGTKEMVSIKEVCELLRNASLLLFRFLLLLLPLAQKNST